MNHNRINLILIVTMILSINLIGSKNVKVNALEQYDFENITESEALEFVSEYDIELPSGISDSTIGEITQSIIKRCANDPTVEFVYNYGEMQEYANRIKEVVSQTSNNCGVSVADESTYTLQYNKVKDSNGNWVTSGGAYDNRWLKYNCYAYSINRIEQPQFYSSGIYIQYQPGNMSGSGTFNSSQNISVLASIVKNDLLVMGYTNVVLYTSIPSLPSGNEELICVRQGDLDYHFMHYDKIENAWLHKPGGTAVLKYNYIPNNDTDWYGEYSSNGTEFFDTMVTYDSDIYFIKYNKPTANIQNNTTVNTNLYIQSGKDSILEISNSTNSNFVINMSCSNFMEVDLYDSEMDFLNSYSGTSVVFETTGSYSKYNLRVNYEATSAYGNVSISLIKHNHSYSFTPYSSTQHNCSCSCGLKFKANHVWTQSSGGIILNVDPNLPNALVKYVCTACGYETNKPPMGV